MLTVETDFHTMRKKKILILIKISKILILTVIKKKSIFKTEKSSKIIKFLVIIIKITRIFKSISGKIIMAKLLHIITKLITILKIIIIWEDLIWKHLIKIWKFLTTIFSKERMLI